MSRVSLIWESILKCHYQLLVINFILIMCFVLFFCLSHADASGVFYVAAYTHSNICHMHNYVHRKQSILAVIDDGDHQHLYHRKTFIVHVLLTSRPGSPSFPCQRTIAGALVLLRVMNRLLLLSYLRLPGHATLVLDLLQKSERVFMN